MKFSYDWKLKYLGIVTVGFLLVFALRIFKHLKINSFNQVTLTKMLKDPRAPRFRFVETFITREIDLAVSELSMLYVVDQHPWDSRNEITQAWETIKGEVLGEFKDADSIHN